MPRETEKLKTEVREMREKMRENLASKDASIFDLKQSQGGIADIEFMVQFLVLAYASQHPELTANRGNLALLETAAELGLIEKGLSGGVRDIYRQLRLTQHEMRLNNLNACRIERNRLDTSPVSSLWGKLLRT